MTIDWYDIKFLESATNVRRCVKRSTGRMPSAGTSREIAVCIQQGRLFFEAAAIAPIQIKPLQIYYGVVSFARSVVLARRHISLATLTATHGLSDTTPANQKIENLALKVRSEGTFHEFNDVLAPLGRIRAYENTTPCWIMKPFDFAASLSGKKVSILDIFSRLPNISEKFSRTFGLPAKATLISLVSSWPNSAHFNLSLGEHSPIADRADLIAIVQRWRGAYPFLEHWSFVEAPYSWGINNIVFDNWNKKGQNDLIEDDILIANGGFAASNRLMMNTDFLEISPVVDIIPPLSGGYTDSSTTYVMQAVEGVTLSEYALQFLGSFILSSLVRYRPQIWQNSLSRSATANDPADDRSLSLIEEFLDDVLNNFPRMVARVITDETWAPPLSTGAK